eukprot:1088092-Amphidinium_carterae.1
MYIPPSECTTREQELHSEKKVRQLECGVGGLVRVQSRAVDITASVNDNLLLKEALMRRGLAYDQANLLTFALHD